MHALARCLVLIALTILWTTATPSAAPAQDIVLVRDGKPAATIVVADRPLWKNVDFDDDLASDPRINPRPYADELQFWIERATGAKLPIVPAAEAPKEGALIVFGESDLSKKLGFDCRNMPPEGFRIVTFDRGVALLGDVFPALERGGYFCNRQDNEYPDPAPVEGDTIDRSIGHATFEFLERFVGYRFYHAADRDSEERIAFGTITPKVRTLTIPAGTDFKKHPDFLHRAGVMRSNDIDDPLAWYRCFRTGASADVHANHTHTSWHRVYGKTHPEVFALDKDGVPYYKKKSVKPPFRSALNYAHPKTLELEIKHIEYYDRTHKLHNGWRAYATPNRLLPTPADGKWYDYSPEAAKLSFPDADMYRQQSDVYWSYIAKLARIAKKRWPERMVVGSAYNRRMCAPTDRVIFPDNVAAQMALCRSSAMTTQKIHREWLNKEIDRWHEKLGRDRTRFGTWDYFCWPHGFYMAPVVHPHRLQAFLKRNEEKIAGQFVNPGGHPRINHMMAVVWHRLLWDVETDVDAVLAEHCRLFYGPAGPFVEELYQLTADRYENTEWATYLTASAIKGRDFFEKIYPPEVVARMKGLFDKAFAAVEGDENALYRKRLHYIYDASDTDSFWGQDGWEAFFRTSERYHADRARVAAERFEKAPDWAKADAATLFRGVHVCTGQTVPEENATRVRFATDGKILRMRIEAGASKELADKVFADGVVLKLFNVPAADKKPDADIDPHEYFMPPDGGKTTQNVLEISIDRGGQTNFKDVTARVDRKAGSWTAEVSIPYAFLGIAPEKGRTIRFDVRRLVALNEFKPQGKRGQAWEGLPRDNPRRKRIEYCLALKEGLPWHSFNEKRRAARLRVK